MGVKIGEIELEQHQADINSISQADMEKLKQLLPDLQQSGSPAVSQLDIILEAIHYIKMLQFKLKSEQTQET